MLNYIDISGNKFQGKDHKAVVRQMRSRAWVTYPKSQYMRDVAERLRILGTKGIAVKNSKEFIKSLIATGWIKPAKSRSKKTTTK